ncbi:MAG: HAMP domain-containing sensor histidine kinase [Oscillospiraceae bacterium]|nr:HAMP domain-containing sensor histidine kinase [Oscillospiraceae bacterium]
MRKGLLTRNYLKNSYFQSLRFRLLLCFLVIGIVPLILFKTVLVHVYESKAVELRMMDIGEQCKILSNQLLAYDYMNHPESEVMDAGLVQLSNIYDGRVLVIDSSFKIIKDTYLLDEGRTIVSEEVFRCFQGMNTARYSKKEKYVEVTAPVRDADGAVSGVILVSASVDNILLIRESLVTKGLLIQISFCAVILVLSLLGSVVLVRPFRKLTHSLEDLNDRDLEEILSVSDYTETQAISNAYNNMIVRIRKQDESRQEFVSNVSHELKTPLTSMKVLADSLIAQGEDVPPELYREFMGDIAEEIDRENKIINDLLSLVKMDKKNADLNIQSMNINDLLELILKRLRPIAAKSDIELVFESFRPVVAEVDEVKLTLALSNLIENAIKYNVESGWVHVSLNADHKFFYVKVADSGIGIPPEDQERIFERFYRVDKSHSREIGGTGLGLAITRNAILMHRGAIKVYSKPGEGTTFTVRIPLSYIH